MKRLLICSLMWCLSLSVAMATPEKYREVLNTINSVAHGAGCWTLSNQGLNATEFARLRAICWRERLGDKWAAGNSVYRSATLSGLEPALSQAQQLINRNRASCKTKDQKAYRWNSTSNVCQCRDGYTQAEGGSCTKVLIVNEPERLCRAKDQTIYRWDADNIYCACRDGYSIRPNGTCVANTVADDDTDDEADDDGIVDPDAALFPAPNNCGDCHTLALTFVPIGQGFSYPQSDFPSGWPVVNSGSRALADNPYYSSDYARIAPLLNLPQADGAGR